MAKKKLDVRSTLGVDTSLTGRKPTRPKSLDARLEQLAKESETWLRLFREVWFDLDDPLIADAAGASELPDLSQPYDDAIEVMRWVEASAAYAQEVLEAGKAKAIKKHADKAKKPVGSKSSAKTRR